MSSKRFTTRQSGDYVLSELYRKKGTPFFPVTLEVLVPDKDSVATKDVRLYLNRTPDKRAVYEHPNGDLVLESYGRLCPTDGPFKVSITLHSGQTSIQGASIAVEEYAADLIRTRLSGC